MTMTTDTTGADRAGSMPGLVLPGSGEFRGLRGGERDLAYMAVEGAVRRLRALQAAMLSEVNRSGSYVDDCHHSPMARVRAVTNSSKGTAVHHVHVAAMLERMPLLAAAAAAGQIGPDQLVLPRRLWANDRCRVCCPIRTNC